MSYKSWKLMDKIDVAVRTGDERYDFTGYIVDHGDKEALEKAKDWTRVRAWDGVKREYGEVYEPKVYTFDNKGFTATILMSAGGSSQGGRLSFWRCEVEKDGVKFTIGVNDAILADLIKNSDLSKGVVKEKVMFARKAGQPGLIHEKMDAYKDATADMAHKSVMKSAKKTSKWEIGGIYSSITMTDICIGEVWDTMEEYKEKSSSYYRYYDTELRKRDTPVKVTAWVHLSGSEETPKTLTEVLEDKLGQSYIYFNAGKPPARAKTGQLEVKVSDSKLIDKLLHENTARYIRELK
jgi:hypothetical protein